MSLLSLGKYLCWWTVHHRGITSQKPLLRYWHNHTDIVRMTFAVIVIDSFALIEENTNLWIYNYCRSSFFHLLFIIYNRYRQPSIWARTSLSTYCQKALAAYKIGTIYVIPYELFILDMFHDTSSGRSFEINKGNFEVWLLNYIFYYS